MTHEFFEAQRGNYLVTEAHFLCTVEQQMLSNDVKNEEWKDTFK